MNYKHSSFEDLQKLLMEDEMKFDEISIEYIRKICKEDAKKD